MEFSYIVDQGNLFVDGWRTSFKIIYFFFKTLMTLF